MFEGGGSASLFNFNLSDFVGFLKPQEDRNLRNLRNERKQLERIQEKAFKESKKIKDTEIKLFNKFVEDINDRHVKLTEEIDKAEFDKKLTPKKTWRHRLDDLTGNFLDLSEIGSATIGKLTTGALSLMSAPIFSSFSLLNDEIQQSGYHSDYLRENFTEINDTLIDINKNVGFFNTKADIAVGTSGQHLQTLLSIRDTYGTVSNATSETLQTISAFPYSIGLSREEGVEFLNVMRGITGESANINANLIRGIRAITMDEGIPMKSAMEDISGNADFFALRSGLGAERMADTVVYARRLGIEMSTINTMMSGLETVEGVIESQMKLSLFTGRQFNLLDSATANFFGRTKEATRGILEQLEQIDETTYNLPFVRKQMAEQLGVSAIELNSIYETVKRIGAEDALQDLNFDESFKRFKDNLTGVGFTQLRGALSRSVFDPLSTAMQKNARYLDDIFSTLSKGIDMIGKSLLAPLFNAFPTTIPLATAILGGLASFAVSKSTELMQLFELKQIKTILASQSASGGGNSFFGGRGGKLMKGLGVAGGASIAIPTIADKKVDSSILQSIMGGAMTGASLGAFTATPFGIGAGALGGAIVGAIADYGVAQLATGGIVTKPLLAHIGEGGQKEAVVPLQSNKGKEMMTTSLSDESIGKLARALSKEGINVSIEYNLNGRKLSSSEEFFNEIAK